MRRQQAIVSRMPPVRQLLAPHLHRGFPYARSIKVTRDLERPVLVSLEALVPKDNMYRQLDATPELSFIREWVKDCYADGGRPSIGPVVFFKLQLVLYLEGLRSERQLMRLAADRLSVRWYIGYQLNEALPDHSTLTRIRERDGLEVFSPVLRRGCRAVRGGRADLGQGVLYRRHQSAGHCLPRLYEASLRSR